MQLRDIWADEISKANGQVEVLSWLSKMTLDVIGLAGKNFLVLMTRGFLT